MEVLEREGWTIELLATKLGENTPTVWRWLKGEVRTPAWFVAAFCDLLGVDGNAIVTPTHQRVDPARRQALNQVALFLEEVRAELEGGRVPTLEKRATPPS